MGRSAATVRQLPPRTARAHRWRWCRLRYRPNGSRSGSIPAPIPSARLATAARAAHAWAKPGIPRKGLKPMNTIRPPSPEIIDRVATVRVTLQVASSVRRSTARQPVVRDFLRCSFELPPGVVDEQVDRAEAVQSRIHDTLDLLGLAHVGGHGQTLSTSCFDLLRSGNQRLLAASADHHVGTRRGELTRRGTPDPRPAAGDERDPAGIGIRTQRRDEGRLGPHALTRTRRAGGRDPGRQAWQYGRRLPARPTDDPGQIDRPVQPHDQPKRIAGG